MEGAAAQLRLLEALGDHPMSLEALAARLKWPGDVVGRVIDELAADHWVDRTGDLVVLGERSLRLGRTFAGTGFRRRVVDLVHMLGAATGLSVSAIVLAGPAAQPIAQASPMDRDYLDAVEPHRYLWSTAGGLALLAAAEPAVLEAALEVDEWPELGPAAPRTPDDVRRIVAAARAGGPIVEHEWTMPGIGCVAMPWWDPETPSPTALAIIGPADAIERRMGPLTHLLAAAVAPGTTAATLADAVDEVLRRPPNG